MGLPLDGKIELRACYTKGRKNLITDVEGVRVGHKTLLDPKRDIHTGVTAILPHTGNLFKEKVMAGVSVLNGFGKSAGLVQIKELGTIETPILMTNTLSVGTALTALTQYMLEQNEDIGVSTGTVNGIVTECNDGSLNDIRGLCVGKEDVLEALQNAGEDFAQGDVGAGCGMCCMGLKGGIGSASRLLRLDGRIFTLGVLVLANFGSAGNLRIGGRILDTRSARQKDESEKKRKVLEQERGEKPLPPPKGEDTGSVIVVMATDLPLSERQLTRLAKRAGVGLARVGSYIGNGSGDIAIAFSTSNRVPHYAESAILPVRMVHDEALDMVFEAAAEAVEESVLSALWYAHSVTGIRGKTVKSLREYLCV